MKKLQVSLLVLLLAGCVQKEQQQEVKEPGNIVWTLPTQGPIHSSPAIDEGGVVYFGSNDGYLYAVLPDGSKKWKYRVGKPIASSPAIGPEGIIYFTADGSLFALHPDGARAWRLSFAGGLPPTASPAIGTDGSIFVGSHTGLYSVGKDGKVNWVFRPDYSTFYSPSLGGDGNIYVGCSNGIWALSQQGEKKWFIEFGPEVMNAFATQRNGLPCMKEVYSEFGLLNSREILRWFKDGGYGFSLPPAIGSDGMLYLSGEENAKPAFCALDPKAGTIRWSRQLEGCPSNTPTIGDDGRIYVASSTGTLYAIKRNGAVDWQIQLGSSVRFSSPAIDGNGILYLGCEDGRLYAVTSSSTGLADSPWPKYRQNNLSSGNAKFQQQQTSRGARQITESQPSTSRQGNVYR